MADERSFDLRRSRDLASRGQAPLHAHAAPTWTDAPLTRQECLQFVPAKVRDTVFDRAGVSIDWWATDLDSD